jgi:hypothetical protein
MTTPHHRRKRFVRDVFHFGSISWRGIARRDWPGCETRTIFGQATDHAQATCLVRRAIDVTSQRLAAHLEIDRYGDFWLTDAIRPSPERQVEPRQGYRIETYSDASAGISVPVLAAAVSRERLFDVFLDLLGPLGEVVDVVLETSHDTDDASHRDLFREHIDMPVLQSHFCDFEELLLHDGCTGVAVLSTAAPMEVQFDEHKLLVVYAHSLKPFERILRGGGVERDDQLKLVTEGEHLHSTEPRYREAFEQLCYRMGVGEPAERVSW